MRWPTIKEVAKGLQNINMMDSEEVDEDTGEPYSIDVRLQVYPDGGWDLHSGDSQYDTDHRGYWGASSVPGSGRRFNATETARELIGEAKDVHAQDAPANNPQPWAKVFG